MAKLALVVWCVVAAVALVIFADSLQAKVSCTEGIHYGGDFTWKWGKSGKIIDNCFSCIMAVYHKVGTSRDNLSNYAVMYGCQWESGADHYACEINPNRLNYYYLYPKEYKEVDPGDPPKPALPHSQCCNTHVEPRPCSPTVFADFNWDKPPEAWSMPPGFPGIPPTSSASPPVLQFEKNESTCYEGSVSYNDHYHNSNKFNFSAMEQIPNCTSCVSLTVLDKDPITHITTSIRFVNTCFKDFTDCQNLIENHPLHGYGTLAIDGAKNTDGSYKYCKECRKQDLCNTHQLPNLDTVWKCLVGKEKGLLFSENLEIKECTMCGYRLMRNFSLSKDFLGGYLVHYFCESDPAYMTDCKHSEMKYRPPPGHVDVYYGCLNAPYGKGSRKGNARTEINDLAASQFPLYNRILKHFPQGMECYVSHGLWWPHGSPNNPNTTVKGCGACSARTKEIDGSPSSLLKCVTSDDDIGDGACYWEKCNWNAEHGKPHEFQLKCMEGNQFAAYSTGEERIGYLGSPVCSVAIHNSSFQEYASFANLSECREAERNLKEGIRKVVCCWNPTDTRCIISDGRSLGNLSCYVSDGNSEENCDACLFHENKKACLKGKETYKCNVYGKSNFTGYSCCFSDLCNPKRKNAVSLAGGADQDPAVTGSADKMVPRLLFPFLCQLFFGVDARFGI